MNFSIGAFREKLSGRIYCVKVIQVRGGVFLYASHLKTCVISRNWVVPRIVKELSVPKSKDFGAFLFWKGVYV